MQRLQSWVRPMIVCRKGRDIWTIQKKGDADDEEEVEEVEEEEEMRSKKKEEKKE